MAAPARRAYALCASAPYCFLQMAEYRGAAAAPSLATFATTPALAGIEDRDDCASKPWLPLGAADCGAGRSAAHRCPPSSRRRACRRPCSWATTRNAPPVARRRLAADRQDSIGAPDLPARLADAPPTIELVNCPRVPTQRARSGPPALSRSRPPILAPPMQVARDCGRRTPTRRRGSAGRMFPPDRRLGLRRRRLPKPSRYFLVFRDSVSRVNHLDRAWDRIDYCHDSWGCRPGQQVACGTPGP